MAIIDKLSEAVGAQGRGARRAPVERQPRGAPPWPMALAGLLLLGTAAWGQLPVAGPTARRVLVQPRGTGGINAESFPSPDGAGQISVITSGVRIVIQDVTLPGASLGDLGTVEIAADRAVVWAQGAGFGDLLSNPGGTADVSWEFYLEGNIVFRQGATIVYADRMYYNVDADQGIILDSELLTPAVEGAGMMRVKADVIRRLDAIHFEALDAAATTSRLGVPRYWVQAGNIQVLAHPLAETPLGGPGVMAVPADRPAQLTSRNNRLYVGGWPVLYWPFFVTDLQRPSTLLTDLRVRNDAIFGNQVQSRWDLYQLLGVRQPLEGTLWTLAADYYSKRGFGMGTHFDYDRDQFLGIPGEAIGFLDAFFLNDQGVDVLGRDRVGIAPEEDLRGRVLARHRQWLGQGYQVTGEIGWVSDRNFLEQFYELEFDEQKDQTTGLQLRRQVDNRSWSILADVRLNDFFTQTEWLPRFDHYTLGQSLGNHGLTWHEHSSAGYARLRTTSTPEDPGQAARFNLLPWEVTQEGIRASTRQELEFPLDLGPVKVAPFVLGEATHWGNDVDGQSATRLLGQTGLRGSVPFWRIYPDVQSELWNVNGLAHKVVLSGELFLADASQNLEDLPLYDPLDDDANEFYRRRLAFDRFGSMTAAYAASPFDERFFAHRSLLQRWVASPSTEVADDLGAMRLQARQRWQTRRGAPGRQRIVDWIVLDTEGLLFTDANRDNFGETIGQLRYDFRWHPGDRVAILSDGFADTFHGGLKTASLGAVLTRPGRGSYFTGIRTIGGPFDSNTLTNAVSYRLSTKWIVHYSSSFDLGPSGNLGQSGSIVRVGESFLVSLALNYDAGRDNFGVRFSVVPRFLPSSLGMIAGVPIPPVGYLGLE